MNKEILTVKPKLIESSIEYVREESSGYLTIIPNNALETKDYTFNPTIRYILSQCDGNTSIKKIINKLIKKTSHSEKEIVTEDVIKTIKLFNYYGILDIGGILMEINQTFNINENLELEQLNESDFKRIIDYIDKANEKSIYHEDIYHCAAGNEREVVLRAHLFSFLSNFYFLKEKGEIKGLISIILNPFQDFSYSTINYMICDKNYVKVFLTSFSDNFKKISNHTLTKLIINLTINENELIDQLQNNNNDYTLEASFKKEYKNMDVLRYTYLY